MKISKGLTYFEKKEAGKFYVFALSLPRPAEIKELNAYRNSHGCCNNHYLAWRLGKIWHLWNKEWECWLVMTGNSFKKWALKKKKKIKSLNQNELIYNRAIPDNIGGDILKNKVCLSPFILLHLDCNQNNKLSISSDLVLINFLKNQGPKPTGMRDQWRSYTDKLSFPCFLSHAVFSWGQEPSRAFHFLRFIAVFMIHDYLVITGTSTYK